MLASLARAGGAAARPAALRSLTSGPHQARVTLLARRLLPHISATSDAANGGGDSAVKPLATACTVLAALVIVKGAAGALAPAQLVSSFLSDAAAASPVNVALTAVSTSVTWVYAAWLWSLKEAAEHQRLGSDTYKRLALGLLGLAILLVQLHVRYIGPLSAGPLSPVVLIGLTAVSMSLTGYLAAQLYATGSGGRSPLADASQIFKSALADIGSLFKTPVNLFSALYSLQAVTSLVVFLWLFPTSITPLFPGGLDLTGVYLTRATAAGAWLIGITAFTLKDASDRGRLGASTFKLLNLALAATLAQQAWYFYSLQGAGVALAGPLWKGIVGQAAVGAAVTGYAWLTAKKK